MAFRRSALLEIGGFDVQFRVAGDDVDICWQLQKRGWTLGFNPASVVWHHRRSSVRAYWRQQRGYGRAEALLERKWPEKYNRLGHVTWGGKVYGGGARLSLALTRGRVYQGMWGSAPFQSLYAPATGMLASFLLMPEWYLVIGGLIAMSLMGLVWPPVLLAAPLAVLATAAVVAQAVMNAAAAHPPGASTRSRTNRLKRFLLITFLNILQPAARLYGRFIHGLTPWRRGRWTRRPAAPSAFRRAIWSEVWREPTNWLERVEALLNAGELAVRRGGDYDDWDLEVASGSLGVARLVLAAEDHAGGKQYVRVKVWPVVPRLPATLMMVSAGLAVASITSSRLVAGIFAAVGLVLLALGLLEAGAATATVRHSVEELEAQSLESRAETAIQSGV